ncbi:unnamed protein product [Ixodes pacificus]
MYRVYKCFYFTPIFFFILYTYNYMSNLMYIYIYNVSLFFPHISVTKDSSTTDAGLHLRLASTTVPAPSCVWGAIASRALVPARPSVADRRRFDGGMPATLPGASGRAELSLSRGSAAEAGLPCAGRVPSEPAGSCRNVPGPHV